MVYLIQIPKEITVLKKTIACSLLLAAPLVTADSLLLDGIDIARPTMHLRPARGTTMERVQASFGSPSIQGETVGEPPISRWDYPGFVVFFEHDLVIHTVATP